MISLFVDMFVDSVVFLNERIKRKWTGSFENRENRFSIVMKHQHDNAFHVANLRLSALIEVIECSATTRNVTKNRSSYLVHFSSRGQRAFPSAVQKQNRQRTVICLTCLQRGSNFYRFSRFSMRFFSLFRRLAKVMTNGKHSFFFFSSRKSN